MKKLFRLVLPALVVLGLLAGCARERVFTNAGEVISVKAGEEFVISLAANPSTGYSWDVAPTVSWLEFLGKTYHATQPVLTGSGGTEELRFRASGAGSATITLNYQRPWEGTAVQQVVFTVEVK